MPGKPIADQGGEVRRGDGCSAMVLVLRALTAVRAESLGHRSVAPERICVTLDGLVKLPEAESLPDTAIT